MSRQHIATLITVLLLLGQIPTLQAHGDLDERIAEATAAVKMYPDSADLYFQRAKLLHQHEEHRAALVDLAKVNTLGGENIIVNMYAAKSALALSDLSLAEKFVTKALAVQPRNVRALQIKGDIARAGGNYDLAFTAYRSVIDFSLKTFPESDASGNADKVYIDDVVLTGCPAQGANAAGPDDAFTVVDTGENTITGRNSDFEISETNGTEVPEKVSLNLYPNPTDGQLNIRLLHANAEMQTTTITDVNGKILYRRQTTKTADSTRQTLDVSDFARGIYFVTVTAGKEVLVKKFVKAD